MKGDVDTCRGRIDFLSALLEKMASGGDAMSPLSAALRSKLVALLHAPDGVPCYPGGTQHAVGWAHPTFDTAALPTLQLTAGLDAEEKGLTMIPSNFSTMLFACLPADLAGRSVCEIGTGGGGILLAARQFLQASRCVGTDYDARVLPVARWNAWRNAADPNHFSWRSGSLFEPVAGEQFDLIFSNPSSMPDILLAGNHANIHRKGGSDGRFMIQALAQQSIQHLRPGGETRFVVGGVCDVKKTLHEMQESGLQDARIVHSELFEVTNRFTSVIKCRQQFLKESGLWGELFRVPTGRVRQDGHPRAGSPIYRWYEMRYVVAAARPRGARAMPSHENIEAMHAVARAQAYERARVSAVGETSDGFTLSDFSSAAIRRC